jgi:hypothetical protein
MMSTTSTRPAADAFEGRPIRRAARRLPRPRLLAPVAGFALAATVLALTGTAGWASPVSPPSDGSLAVTSRVDLGASSTTEMDEMVDAEAGDGTFYFARNSTVDAVRGAVAPQEVLHATGKVLALAATAADLYVQTGLTVGDYSLPGGALRRSWALPPERFAPHSPPTSAGLLAAGGVVWSWTDWSTDFSGFEYANVQELSAVGPPRPITDDAYPSDMAADATGLYYEETVGADSYLVHVTANGAKTLSRPSQVMDAPMAIAPGSVLLFGVKEPSGDPYLFRFSPTSLAALGSVRLGSEILFAVETSAGLLTIGCNPARCASNAVGLLDPLTAAVSGSVVVPGLVALVKGSAPAALAEVGGHGYLVRLGTGALKSLGTSPVLGSRSFNAPGAAGWGTVEPKKIFNGGDPSGLVEDIVWSGWGTADAYGDGEGFINRPTGGYYPLVKVELRADMLGRCTPGGPPAYEHLDIRVPSRPGAPLGSWIPWGGTGSICSSGI